MRHVLVLVGLCLPCAAAPAHLARQRRDLDEELSALLRGSATSLATLRTRANSAGAFLEEGSQREEMADALRGFLSRAGRDGRPDHAAGPAYEGVMPVPSGPAPSTAMRAGSPSARSPTPQGILEPGAWQRALAAAPGLFKGRTAPFLESLTMAEDRAMGSTGGGRPLPSSSDSWSSSLQHAGSSVDRIASGIS